MIYEPAQIEIALNKFIATQMIKRNTWTDAHFYVHLTHFGLTTIELVVHRPSSPKLDIRAQKEFLTENWKALMETIEKDNVLALITIATELEEQIHSYGREVSTHGQISKTLGQSENTRARQPARTAPEDIRNRNH